MRGLLTTAPSTTTPPARARRRRGRRTALALCLLASAAAFGEVSLAAGPALASSSAPANRPLAGMAPAAVARAPVAFAQSAATLYALNCMGCHPPPRNRDRDAGPLRGEFYHSALGRNFFIRIPQDGKRVLGAAEDARLLEEIMTWKRSCAAILQDAPLVNYSGERFVK